MKIYDEIQTPVIIIIIVITISSIMANPFISGRIPSELLEAVEKRTRETGETKTDILINALQQYLNFQVKATNNNPQTEIEKLTKDVKTLMSIVSKHEEAIQRLSFTKRQSENYQATLFDLNNNDNSDNKTDNIQDSQEYIDLSESAAAKLIKIKPHELAQKRKTPFEAEIKGVKYKVSYKRQEGRTRLWDVTPIKN